jgi:hypothetical protein
MRDMTYSEDDGYDGVAYDTEHADGHLDQFSTFEEDERAFRRLSSRAAALGLPVWDGTIRRS